MLFVVAYMVNICTAIALIQEKWLPLHLVKTAIIGGGAAGFFLAVNLKEMVPEMEVTVFERHQRVLAKVEISGGGRCNCTNSFDGVGDLSVVYPRGHRLMKRLLHVFSQHDAYQWFERHGVHLTTQDDCCVFPASQDSHTIINCFLYECRRLGVIVRTGQSIMSLEQLADYDFKVITVGGQPRRESLLWLESAGHTIEPPVPSLFTVRIDDPQLNSLMGTVVDDVVTMIPGTKFRAEGPLLLTHWGMSGPSVLRLSSYAARHLAEHNYCVALAVNWTKRHDTEMLDELSAIVARHQQKQLSTIRPADLPARLWSYLIYKWLGERAHAPWGSLNRKELNRLANLLSGGDQYQVAGRAAFKDEFVTCGGISLSSVNPSTLESRTVPGLYFSGEVLDVDGITGGFNFQAAWTTAYTVATSIAGRAKV